MQLDRVCGLHHKNHRNRGGSDAAWSAFSGLLSKVQLEHAQWGGDKKKKPPGSRSMDVFNITAFQVAESAAPPTPIQSTVFQLTDAKVIVQPTPDGHAAPVGPSNFLLEPILTIFSLSKRSKYANALG